MAPRRHEIYLIRWRLRKSFDHRPCIVLDAPKRSSTCTVLVSSSDLYRPGYDFLISVEHPDFPATGLLKTSFAIGDQIHEIPTAMLTERLGALEGELARAFDEWLG